MHFGACATLGRVAESGVFPLLGQTVSRIADHTNQCKITLGGNLAGTIRYREASLPLWIADAQAQLAGPQGLWSVPFDSVFDGRLRLEAQALLLSFSIPEPAAKWPFVHYKFVRADKIDYPLFTLVAARDDNGLIRLALSGVCCAPLRNADMEAAINDRKGTVEQRAQAAIERLPGPVLDDHLGSAEYRLFRLGLALRDAIDTLEGHSDAKA